MAPTELAKTHDTGIADAELPDAPAECARRTTTASGSWPHRITASWAKS
jgi:hypothetical protein